MQIDHDLFKSKNYAEGYPSSRKATTNSESSKKMCSLKLFRRISKLLIDKFTELRSFVVDELIVHKQRSDSWVLQICKCAS